MLAGDVEYSQTQVNLLPGPLSVSCTTRLAREYIITLYHSYFFINRIAQIEQLNGNHEG